MPKKQPFKYTQLLKWLPMFLFSHRTLGWAFPCISSSAHPFPKVEMNSFLPSTRMGSAALMLHFSTQGKRHCSLPSRTLIPSSALLEKIATQPSAPAEYGAGVAYPAISLPEVHPTLPVSLFTAVPPSPTFKSKRFPRTRGEPANPHSGF